MPETIKVASLEILKQLAALAPEVPKQDQSYRGNGRAPFDIDSFIAKSGLEVAFADAWNGGRKWILKTCPWNGDHQNRSAFVLQFPNGAVTAGCHHNGCSGKGWADLREMFEPGWQKKKAQAQPKFTGESQKARAPRKWVDAMEAIEEQDIDWLWRDRIPRGRLTEFLGDPGIGKSHAAQAIAAYLSTGRALPGDVELEAPLRTLILNFEDGAGDTIKPHLRKLGADMSMVGVPAKSNRLLPTQFNAAVLGQMLDEFPAALVVVDPALAVMSRKNTDRASDVRDILSPLADLAEKRNAALLLIRHLNKSVQSRAIYRGQGSMDFNAIVRSSFIFGQDSENPERRFMAHLKNSLGKKKPTLEFTINDDGVFSFVGETNQDADDVLGTGEPKRQRDAHQLQAAKSFLEKLLSDGPMPSNDVKDKADKAGIAWRTIWRAKNEIEIKASKERGTGEWFWRLA